MFEVDLGLSAWLEEGGVTEVSGCRSVQGRPLSSAGCSEPEQSRPSLARQALCCSSMKSPCCVCKIHRHQVSWGFTVQSVLTKTEFGLTSTDPSFFFFKLQTKCTRCERSLIKDYTGNKSRARMKVLDVIRNCQMLIFSTRW